MCWGVGKVRGDMGKCVEVWGEMLGEVWGSVLGCV